MSLRNPDSPWTNQSHFYILFEITHYSRIIEEHTSPLITTPRRPYSLSDLASNLTSKSHKVKIDFEMHKSVKSPEFFYTSVLHQSSLVQFAHRKRLRNQSTRPHTIQGYARNADSPGTFSPSKKMFTQQQQIYQEQSLSHIHESSLQLQLTGYHSQFIEWHILLGCDQSAHSLLSVTRRELIAQFGTSAISNFIYN